MFNQYIWISFVHIFKEIYFLTMKTIFYLIKNIERKKYNNYFLFTLLKKIK